MKFKFSLSKKLLSLPQYPFIEIDKKKKEAIKKGINIISFGVGDPDLPPDDEIIQEFKKALDNPENHQYPFGPGKKIFREAVNFWYRNRFGVDINPENEIHALIGSKEGIAHLPFCLINKGDYVIVPEPAYSVYERSSIIANAKIFYLPLKEENNFLPDFKKIPKSVLQKTKILFLNYPNNPTTALATEEFFQEVIDLATKYRFLVVHDAAYSEIYYDSPPISLLQLPKAKEVGVEFHSCSKTFNITGWRIGWICGNPQIIDALSKMKDNIDSGVFGAVQDAAAFALTKKFDFPQKMRKIYKRRRDLLQDGLKDLNFKFFPSRATFYLWVKVPSKFTSNRFAQILIDKTGIVVVPGSGLGPSGEGYVRFAFCVSEEKIKEAINRLKSII